ncbi:uncharacterized protein LOC144916359 [Branchiostoma floridae x Branchiostoma belcheri]
MSNNSSAAVPGPSKLDHADPFECYAWNVLQQHMSYDEAVNTCHWYEEAPFSKVLSVLYVLVGVTIVVCNILVLWGIISKKRLHQPMYIYVANLAVTDLLAGAMILWRVSDNVDHYKPYNVLQVRVVTMFSQMMSAFALNLLTVDRYVAVKYPIFYHNQATYAQRNAGVAIVCSWVVIPLVVFSCLMRWNCTEEQYLRLGHCLGLLPLGYILLNSTLILFLIGVLLFLNIIVYKAVKQRQLAKLKKQLFPLRERKQEQNQATSSDPSTSSKSATRPNKQKSKLQQKDNKILQSSTIYKTRVVMIFAIVAVVFWLLGLIVMSVKWILQKTYPEKDQHKQVMPWAILVFCLNSVVNPLAGINRLTDLREAIGQQLCKLLSGLCTCAKKCTCWPKCAPETQQSEQNNTKKQDREIGKKTF